MTSNSRSLSVRALVPAVVLLCAPAAIAATSWDFLFSAGSVSDDRQLFLNLAVREGGYDRHVLEPLLPRLAYVQADLPVVLFLARESGRSVDFIISRRASGLGWAVIFNQLHVPCGRLFVGIDRDPGPPYGKAWGYWKRHPRRMRFSDETIRGLCEVQIAHRIVGLPPYELVRAGGAGPHVYTFVAEKKGRPWKGAAPPGHARGNDQGEGHGHGHEGGPPGHAKKGSR